jgi:GTPase-activator protein for Ras-like GTPase
MDRVAATSTLFRGNSVFTKTMEYTMRFYGRSFLDASIGPIIRRLCNERVEIELDPVSHARDQERSRTSARSDRDGTVEATRTLMYWCNEVWSQIYNARTECPM